MHQTQPTESSAPQLGKPGAGLPKMEAFFSRYVIMRLGPRLFSIPRAHKWFDEANTDILKIVKSAETPELLTTPVLIPKIPGLEDSSRYWSVMMVLSHLITVSEGIERIIVALSQGVRPHQIVRIEDVKPPENLSGNLTDPAQVKQTIEEFEKMSTTLVPRLNRLVKDWNSLTTLPHPWFGEMTARQWNFLLGIHQRLHLRQIELIMKEVSP